MTEDRLNAYHIMWLFVFFDLPVTTKKEMKAASLFRKNLEKDGFSMTLIPQHYSLTLFISA